MLGGAFASCLRLRGHEGVYVFAIRAERYSHAEHGQLILQVINPVTGRYQIAAVQRARDWPSTPKKLGLSFFLRAFFENLQMTRVLRESYKLSNSVRAVLKKFIYFRSL